MRDVTVVVQQQYRYLYRVADLHLQRLQFHDSDEEDADSNYRKSTVTNFVTTDDEGINEIASGFSGFTMAQVRSSGTAMTILEDGDVP